MLEIKDVVTWLKNWFYDKNEVYAKTETYNQSTINNKVAEKVSINQGSGNANKNICTDSSGNISVEEKITTGSGLAFDGNVANKINHSNSVNAQNTKAIYKFKHDGQGHITESTAITGSDLPSHNHTGLEVIDGVQHVQFIGTDSNASQRTINSAIDSGLAYLSAEIDNLEGIKAIEVVPSKPTASENTMGKLYIVSENGKVNVYYTKQSGTSPNYTYSWQKMDTDILDDLSVDWSDINNKPTATSDFTNDGASGNDTYVESGDLGDVAFSNSYSDLDNIPSTFSPAAHTHGNLSNDGKLTTTINTTNKIVVTDSSNNIGVVEVDELNCGTFAELQALIGTTSQMKVVVLDKDYKNSGNESKITVPSLVTIIGNGHVIDADGKSRIFDVGSEVSLTGITFKNGKATQRQGEVLTNGYGGALYLTTGCKVIDCNFIDNNASRGGAIYTDSQYPITIMNCSFANENPQSYIRGEWIYNAGSSYDVYNCKSYGMEVSGGSGDSPFYNVVNKAYLTDHQSLNGYLQTGDAVTSIALVPKGDDPTADAYNGVIKLYFSDEPSS